MVDRACYLFRVEILNSKFDFKLSRKNTLILLSKKFVNRSKLIFLFLNNKLNIQFFNIFKNSSIINQKEVKFVYL
jgi:hypothetical protein